MNITLPYIDEKSGSGARARAPPERGPLLLFLAFQTRHLRITTLIGATRDLSDPWFRVDSRRRVSRRFQLVLKELKGGEEEGDAEEYWMDNADVKVSRRGNYFFSTTPQTSQRWIIMIDRMRRVKEFVQELYIYRVGYIHL